MPVPNSTALHHTQANIHRAAAQKIHGLSSPECGGVRSRNHLLISRLKVRFLHGSPFDRGAATPPDSSFPVHQSVTRPWADSDCSNQRSGPACPSPFVVDLEERASSCASSRYGSGTRQISGARRRGTPAPSRPDRSASRAAGSCRRRRLSARTRASHRRQATKHGSMRWNAYLPLTLSAPTAQDWGRVRPSRSASVVRQPPWGPDREGAVMLTTPQAADDHHGLFWTSFDLCDRAH